MSPNPLLSLSDHSDFKVPVYFNDDHTGSYRKQLIAHFQRIIDFLTPIHPDLYGSNNKSVVIGKVSRLQFAIIATLEKYLEGHPAQAYKIFSDAMFDYGMLDEVYTVHQFKVDRDSKLFRIQVNYDPLDLTKGKVEAWGQKSRLDLFHPAFQRRRAVRTTRFSISGYPCLYLSENLITSYSECFPDGENFKGFNSVCYTNNRPMYFLDLSRHQLDLNAKPTHFGGVLPMTDDPALDIAAITEGLDIFQLILSTHTKIDYEEFFPNELYAFKAEYIIPQLLLQWVKQEGLAIDGIRYKSCTGDKRFPTLTHDHYNYVLPVKESLDKGFCPELTDLFATTQVYSYLDDKMPADVPGKVQQIEDALRSATFHQLKDTTVM